MNVKVEKKENSVVEIEFTMDKEQFNLELDKAFKANAKKFNVPGFRKGMVPRQVVEKTYGEGVLYEFVIENTVDEAYRTAVVENELDIVSRPELNIKQIGKDKDFIFVVTVCVKPEAKVKDYKGIEVKKVSTRVLKKDVDEELERIREKNARIVSVEDKKRALKNGDISVIDFEGFVDGVAFEGGKGENFELTIGSGQFIPGFEDQMVGMKVGEERDVNVKFPDEYHAPDLAGKDATFKVKLHEIKEKILPELDDEFAKDTSEFDTLDELKNSIKEKLEHENKHRAEHEIEDAAIKAVTDAAEVDIPSGMVDTEIDNMVRDIETRLSYQGMRLDQYLQMMGKTMEDFRKENEEQAKNAVKTRLTLEAIVNAEKIEPTVDEIESKVKEMAEMYGQEAEKLQENEQFMHYIKDSLKSEAVIKFIIENAKIK